MAQFTDNAGHTWIVTLNVDVVKRVRSLCGLDLLDVGSLTRLAEDPVLLCDVVYAVCKSQADDAEVTDEDFGRAMAGDAIEEATNGLLEELANFFPSRRRELIKKALKKMGPLQEMALQAAEARLESGEIEAQVKAALDAASGGPSMSSPESSGSTPAPSP